MMERVTRYVLILNVRKPTSCAMSAILMSILVLTRPAMAQAICHAADEHSADVINEITSMMGSDVDTQTRSEFGVTLVSESRPARTRRLSPAKTWATPTL